MSEFGGEWESVSFTRERYPFKKRVTVSYWKRKLILKQREKERKERKTEKN
jgi:hypothetical protein